MTVFEDKLRCVPLAPEERDAVADAIEAMREFDDVVEALRDARRESYRKWREALARLDAA